MTGAGTVPLGAVVSRGEVTAFVAVAGVIVGSFLNVVIYRVPRHLSVATPPSFCPHCDTRVRAFDNIPVVSWVLLRGRCRQCRGEISVRYPLVELSTGIVFAAVAWGFGPHWVVAGYCVLAATLIGLVGVELDGLTPPLSVAVIGVGIADAFLLAAGVADRHWPHVVGVAIGTVLAAGLVVMSRHRRFQGVDSPDWISTAPLLLPVGAALSALGPAAAAEGLGTSVVVVLVTRGLQQRRASTTSLTTPVVFGLALAGGVVVAMVVAVAVGSGAGI
jgi:prepilin signal peptidase PulO-like enzyme (type II secretory pathway)